MCGPDLGNLSLSLHTAKIQELLICFSLESTLLASSSSPVITLVIQSWNSKTAMSKWAMPESHFLEALGEWQQPGGASGYHSEKFPTGVSWPLISSLFSFFLVSCITPLLSPWRNPFWGIWMKWWVFRSWTTKVKWHQWAYHTLIIFIINIYWALTVC